jgi:hypothetical protein
MCCRLDIRPLDRRLAAAVLTIGRFETLDETRAMWRRYVDEESASILARFEADHLALSISPSIANMAHHHGKRVTASIYFEIAARYAEKVLGTITQRATVMGCRPEQGECLLLVARYPDLPISFERVCKGFQSVLLPPREEGQLSPVTGAWLHHHQHPGGHHP